MKKKEKKKKDSHRLVLLFSTSIVLLFVLIIGWSFLKNATDKKVTVPPSYYQGKRRIKNVSFTITTPDVAKAVNTFSDGVDRVTDETREEFLKLPDRIRRQREEISETVSKEKTSDEIDTKESEKEEPEGEENKTGEERKQEE